MNKAFCEVVKLSQQDIVVTSGGPECPNDGGSTPCGAAND